MNSIGWSYKLFIGSYIEKRLNNIRIKSLQMWYIIYFVRSWFLRNLRAEDRCFLVILLKSAFLVIDLPHKLVWQISKMKEYGNIGKEALWSGWRKTAVLEGAMLPNEIYIFQERFLHSVDRLFVSFTLPKYQGE